MADVKTDSLPSSLINSDGSAGPWNPWINEDGGGTSVPTGFEYTGSDAVQLVSKAIYDEQGRLTRTIDAAGTSSYIVYKQQEARVYPAWDATNHVPTLPVQVARVNDAGEIIEQFAFDPAHAHVNAGSQLPDGADTETQSDYVSWNRRTYNTGGNCRMRIVTSISPPTARERWARTITRPISAMTIWADCPGLSRWPAAVTPTEPRQPTRGSSR